MIQFYKAFPEKEDYFYVNLNNYLYMVYNLDAVQSNKTD